MTTIERLVKVVGYPPDEIPAGATAASLVVDGRPFTAREDAGRLVLSCVLAEEPEDETLERLSGYALGRMLKEEATLAWDPAASRLLLWQAVSSAVSDSVLARFFEVFATSADWWFARVRDEASVARIPDMVIRP